MKYAKKARMEGQEAEKEVIEVTSLEELLCHEILMNVMLIKGLYSVLQSVSSDKDSIEKTKAMLDDRVVRLRLVITRLRSEEKVIKPQPKKNPASRRKK